MEVLRIIAIITSFCSLCFSCYSLKLSLKNNDRLRNENRELRGKILVYEHEIRKLRESVTREVE